MSTSKTTIRVSGTPVEVLFKDIKNLHLSVNPPKGEVRVSAPKRYTEDEVRLAVVQRLAWIRKEQKRLADASRQTERQMVNGETHYVLGRGYRLRVDERPGRTKFVLKDSRLVLEVAPGTDRDYRFGKLEDWYREILKRELSPLIAKWEKELGVEVPKWTIRRMKTKWGSCNRETRHIWFNLELAKKDPKSIEYIVVHEMTHYFERNHGAKFAALMDRHLPDWQTRQANLNAEPLAAEKW